MKSFTCADLRIHTTVFDTAGQEICTTKDLGVLKDQKLEVDEAGEGNHVARDLDAVKAH